MSSNYGSSLRLALKQSLMSTTSSDKAIAANKTTPTMPTPTTPPRSAHLSSHSHTSSSKRSSTPESPNCKKRLKSSECDQQRDLTSHAENDTALLGTQTSPTTSSPRSPPYIGNSLRLAIIESKRQAVDITASDVAQLTVTPPFTKRRQTSSHHIQYISPTASSARITIEVPTRAHFFLPDELMLSSVLPCLYLKELVALRCVSRHCYHLISHHSTFSTTVPLLNDTNDSKIKYRGLVRTVGMHTPIEYHMLMPALHLAHWCHNHNSTCHYCAAYQPDLHCRYCNVSYHNNCVAMLPERDICVIQKATARLGQFVCADCASESSICVAGCPLVIGLSNSESITALSSYVRSTISNIAVLGGDEYYSLSANMNIAYHLHLPTENWRQETILASSTRYISSANTYLISSSVKSRTDNRFWLLQFEYVYISNIQAVDYSKIFVAPISPNTPSNWIQVHIDTDQCFAPPQLVNVAIAVHKGILVVQGGRRVVDNYAVPCNDIFVLNTGNYYCFKVFDNLSSRYGY